jgi:hypothetical protein
MNSRLINGYVVFFVLLLTIGLTYIDFFQKPGLLFSAAGDGMKNYFTFLYHVKHDSTYWKFEGMNYPFGENIVFTDNQPIMGGFWQNGLHSLVGLSDGAH